MMYNGIKVPDGLLPTGTIKKMKLSPEQSAQLKALETSQRGNRTSKERRKYLESQGK